MTTTSHSSHFTDIILEQYSNRVSNRHTIGLSGIGKDERVISLESRFSWPDVPKPRNAMIFALGDAVEEIIDSVIPDEHRHPDGNQLRLVLESGHITGHVDNVLRIAVKNVLAEYKSCNQARFKKLERLGSYELWDDAYYHQIQAYMGACNELHGLEIDECHVVVMNKNTCDLYEEVIAFDPLCWERIKEKCKNLVSMTSVPPPTMKASDYRVKNFMTEEQQKIYMGEWTPPQPNCRNCAHSRRDLNDPIEKRGRWGCKRKKKVLTLEEQRLSCDDHQWIPELVPARCIDEDSKTYQRDSLEFRNDVDALSSEKIAWLCRANWDIKGSEPLFKILDEFEGSLTL